MEIISKDGSRIQKVDDWFRYARPKGGTGQWVDGRSAKETARAWLGDAPSIPSEVQHLLATSPDLAELQFERAVPEALLPFDKHSGPRNADLAIWARGPRGPVAITVEAKADETFGPVVEEALSDALERLVKNPRSGGVARIADLASSLFAPVSKGQPAITNLRYQLLTAVAGTLAHGAKIGAKHAVLVVHEFVTTATSRHRLNENAADLAGFVHRLSRGTVVRVEAGQLYGPFVLPGNPLFDPPASLFIGKATRNLGEPEP